MQGNVKVEGIREVRAQLKAVSEGADREVKRAYQRVANEVTDASQYRALSEGSTAAFVAPSIRSGISVKAATILLGSGTLVRKDGTTVKASFVAPGAEFGSSYKQFKPWRGNGAEAGYFIYPTIRAMKNVIERDTKYEFDQMIERTLPL